MISMVFRSTLIAVVLYIAQTQAQCPSGCKPGYKCILNNCVVDIKCPAPTPYGKGPPSTCTPPTDPLNKPKSKLESWFTQDIFNDLFPKANIGWGPHKCWPYSYEAFVIAARYFPDFATESPNNGYKPEENYRRDLAAFFSHVMQETGENDISLYQNAFKDDWEKADACFYRGGFYNWFEGGPKSSFLPPDAPGFDPKDGERCIKNAQYCIGSYTDYPCNEAMNGSYYLGCYFGRGAIQLSYNFNYGPFQNWLKSQGINVDLLKSPNLLMTKMDPPLSIMASMWFYMTPQPPKPAMHDIVLGNWLSSDLDAAAGYKGPAFGPTSLIINNECHGEDADTPGGPGESRRIKAFKWFSKYFGFRLEDAKLLSCGNMQKQFDAMNLNVSYTLDDWANLQLETTCNCKPVTYFVKYPYFQPAMYTKKWTDMNEYYRQQCVRGLYEDPRKNQMSGTEPCLKHPPPGVPIPTRPPTTPRPPGVTGGPVECPSIGAMVPDPQACSNYYLCDAKLNPIKKNCPSGTLFSVAAGTCDWAAKVDCGGIPGGSGQAATDKPSKPALPPGSFQCPDIGVFPDSASCSSFFECDGAGLAGHKQTCPPKLVFDPKAKACNWASMVDCNGKPANNPATQAPATAKPAGCA